MTPVWANIVFPPCSAGVDWIEDGLRLGLLTEETRHTVTAQRKQTGGQ